MTDYTVRLLSEDCEVLNEQELLVQEDDNEAQIAFLEFVESAEDVMQRSSGFDALTVQLSEIESGRVLRERRIGLYGYGI